MSTNGKLRESNESITFRLKPDIIKGLRTEAENRGITLNTLITQMHCCITDLSVKEV